MKTTSFLCALFVPCLAHAYDPTEPAPPADGSAAAPANTQTATGVATNTPTPAPAPTVKPPPPEHSVAITISPVHLIFPVVEIMGEVKLLPNLSASLILGAGSLTIPATTGIPQSKARAYEAGAQFVFYPVGDFEHGMQLGAEGLFAYVDGAVKPTNGGADIVYGGKALSTGAFLGYKVSAGIGFTFVAQLGAAYTSVLAEAAQSTIQVSATKSGISPLLNLNVGWAF